MTMKTNYVYNDDNHDDDNDDDGNLSNFLTVDPMADV